MKTRHINFKILYFQGAIYIMLEVYVVTVKKKAIPITGRAGL
jgi:hypothetical protein